MANVPDRPDSASGDEPSGATGNAGTGTGAQDAPADAPGASGLPAATSSAGEGETGYPAVAAPCPVEAP